jgi:integrase
MPLTDVQIRQAKPKNKPYNLTDGKGMFIVVMPNGSKLWRYKYRIAGKQKPYAIGSYPDVSIVQAREDLKFARKLVKQGIDPVHHREATKAIRLEEHEKTFQVIAKAWINKRRSDWSDDYAKQIADTFKRHVYKFIGQRPIGSLTAIDVLDVLEKMQDNAPTLAAMTRQWMSGVFRYAIVRRLAEYNPAEMLRGEIKHPPKKKKEPLTPTELPVFLKDLDEYESRSQVQQTTVLAMRLMLYTFLRTSEIKKATWSEIEWGSNLWRVPVERMKKRRVHLVPLSDQVTLLLKKLNGITGHQPLLFPNTRSPKQPMNKGTINAALAFMGYAGRLSGHAFRNTASTNLHELGYNTDHIEMQLSHFDGGVRGRYNSAQYLKQRIKMMQGWADYLDDFNEKINQWVPNN